MKVWHVTGSSRGLGRAIAEAIFADGDLVLVRARRTEALQKFVKQFGEHVAADRFFGAPPCGCS